MMEEKKRKVQNSPEDCSGRHGLKRVMKEEEEPLELIHQVSEINDPSPTDHSVKIEEGEAEVHPSQEIRTVEASCPERNLADASLSTPESFQVNSVEALQQTPFWRRSLADQLQVIEMGPERPPLMLQQSGCDRGKEYTRRFSAKWYDRKEWLCGSAAKDALFCFPCLLSVGGTTWTQTGVRDLKHLADKIKKHEESKSHMDNCVKLAKLSKNSVVQLGEDDLASIKKHNQEVENNRYKIWVVVESISNIIDSIPFCDAFELGLSDQDETEDSMNLDMFGGQLNPVAPIDLVMELHMQNSSVLRDLSKTTQNEVLDCMSKVVKDYIKQQVKSAHFVAMEVAHISVSSHSQMALTFRYINEHSSLVECFYAVAELEDHRAENMAAFLLQQLEDVFPEAKEKQKLIAQSYDGLSMAHGDHIRVQNKIQEVFPHAQYVHSSAHQLNVVMQQVASQIQEVGSFFANLSKIPEFFASDAKAKEVLETILGLQHSRSTQTNWNLNIQTANYVFEKRLELIECFLEIKRTWKSDDPAVQMADQILQLLEKDGEFLYFLSLFHRIMPQVDAFRRQLWVSGMGPVAVKKAASNFVSTIGSVGDSIGSLFSKLPSESVLPKGKTKETLDQMASEACNVIIAHAKERFAFTTHLLGATLVQGTLFWAHNRTFPQAALDQTVEAYPMLEKERLKTELGVLYKMKELYSCTSLSTLLCVLIDTPLEQTRTLLRIAITTPKMVVEAEQTPSALKRVKALLRNTASQDRLSALATLFIEKEKIKNIPDFNNKTIELFARQGEHHADYMYK
nr:uncharacterized protein LOC132765241 isoform X1 [Anolis sagrei ordinatus]XP_060615459.1 uncharacterized protein LOC132765241 isoform X1 [Anolis sagrei ordinatus]XP_060615460.1 uncharacterized protein LOC132765241 isoform X1 [Anolis sagrei ordinatus]